MNKRKLTSADFYEIAHATDVQIAPDGSRIAYVRTHMAEETNAYHRDIFLTTPGADAVNLTQGRGNSDSPRWSPDGSKLAFLSTRKGGGKALYLCDGTKDDDTFVLSMPGGIAGYAWSPDGTTISFVSSVEMAPVEEVKHVTRMKQRDEIIRGGFGYHLKRHIYLLDVSSGETRQLTGDDFVLEHPEMGNIGAPAWSHDGTRLAFVGRRQDWEQQEFYAQNADVYVIDLQGHVQGIKKVDGAASSLVWAKDDKSIYFVGHLSECHSATTAKICQIILEDQAFSIVSGQLDRTVGYSTLCDCGAWLGASDATPKLSKDGKELYFLAADHGTTALYALQLQTQSVKKIIDGPMNLYGFTLSYVTGQVAYCYSSWQAPGDAALFDLKTGTTTPLTALNADFLSGIELADVEHMTFQAGDTMADGWIVKPTDASAENPCPVIINIHGGPFSQFGWAYTFEFQFFAAKGYAVAYSNPRGSRGYGQAFAYALKEHFANVAYDDVMHFTDLVAELPYIDGTRMAVAGQSYGGFLTNWVVTRTNRFQAAVAQSSVSNWMTMCGLSDFGYLTGRLLLQGRVDDLVGLWPMSPLAYAKQVETPLLLVHSENDYRCPIEQSEQFYTALKYHRKNVEMLRFPNSDHSLLRNGLPRLRIQRLDALYAYLHTYLN